MDRVKLEKPSLQYLPFVNWKEGQRMVLPSANWPQDQKAVCIWHMFEDTAVIKRRRSGQRLRRGRE